MIRFKIGAREYELSRDSVIIDTCVLAAYFSDRDQKHEEASVFFDDLSGSAIIPISVVVETWGLLVGRDRRVDLGLKLLSWVNTPGRAMLLPDNESMAQNYQITVRQFEVDLVDAMIVCLADTITRTCSLNPAIDIVTFDMRDFIKCLRAKTYKFRLWDLEAYEKYS